MASADAILLADLGGEILMANTAALKLFNYSESDLLGANVDILVPEQLRGAHRHHRQLYAEAPQSRYMGEYSGPLLGRRSDGSTFPVEISLSSAIDGQSASVLAILRDISERQAFDYESEMVRHALESTTEAVFIFDVETLRFRYVNYGACQQTGYRRSELLSGMTPIDIKPEHDRESFERLISPLLSGVEPVLTFETVHRTKDGGDVPVEVMLQSPTPLGDGRLSLIALVRDISVRLAQHERLVSSEQAFRSAFEDAPVGMAIAELGDPDERVIVSANAALGQMLGYLPDDLVGRTFKSLTHPEDNASDLSGAIELSTSKISRYQAEKRYIHSDGHIVPAQLSAVMLGSPSGPRALAHIVDATRRVKVEAERDQRERLLSFLGDIRLAVLSDAPVGEVFDLILSAAKSALDASEALIAMPDSEGSMRITAADTSEATTVIGQLLNSEDFSPEPASVAAKVRFASPLEVGAQRLGVLVVNRPPGSEPFSAGDLAFVKALSTESAVVLEFQKARRERTQLKLAEDRERIARELQDHVIQDLFAVGMSLQANLESPERLQKAATAAIQDLDSSIAVVRDSIFNLESRRSKTTGAD